MKNKFLLVFGFIFATKFSFAKRYSALNDDLLYVYAGIIFICAFFYGLVLGFKKLKKRFNLKQESDGVA
jgi:hypothetical protein